MLLRYLTSIVLLYSSQTAAWNWPSIWGPPITTTSWNASVEAFAAREYFYVGGNYINTTSGHLFANQMYVEKLIPGITTQPYPLVFIHGQAQTGTNWLVKPDGRAGWATYFLSRGYLLYIID